VIGTQIAAEFITFYATRAQHNHLRLSQYFLQIAGQEGTDVGNDISNILAIGADETAERNIVIKSEPVGPRPASV
jgi:hypothetical protein